MYYKKKRSKKKFSCQAYSSKNGKVTKEQIEAVANKVISQKYMFIYVTSEFDRSEKV